jgi:glutathione S-transferase
MLLGSTLTNIGGRARHWNEMQEFLAFVQFQVISEEIKSHFSALDSCLTMFSVRLFAFAARFSLTDIILLSTLPTSLKISGLGSLAPFSVKS